MATDLTVVVVTYNSAHVIDGLLDSLPDALGGLRAQIVVVDNGSTDDTVVRLEERGGCTLIHSTNIGYAGGINKGVRSVERTRAVLVVNPDVRMHPGSVPPMLEAVEHPGIGIAAPQVRSADGSLHRSLRREPSLPRTLGLTGTGHPIFAEYVMSNDEYTSPMTVDWALGAVLLISRECYDAVGGWDESYFLYSEETDFCLRARDLGYRTQYQPEAIATHIGAQSGQGAKEHVMQTVNRVRLYRRRHGPVASWMYLGLTALREVTWIPRGNEHSRAAVVALFRPGARAPELNCSRHVMPT